MKNRIIPLALAVIMLFMTSCKNIDDSVPSQTSINTYESTENITYTEFTELIGDTETIIPESQTELTTELTTVAPTESVTQATSANGTTKAVETTTTVPITTTVTTTTAPPVTTTITTTQVTTTSTTEQTTASPSYFGSYGYKALNYSEQKAIWISFLEFQNILKGKSEKEFTASVRNMYDNCAELGINTVYVHARSHGDAFYNSDIYPWSKNITGTIDGTPAFDPYKILIDEAHERGLSFHAWINPMRTLTTSDMSKISDSYTLKQWAKNKNGTYIVNVNGTYWLSPAYSEVRSFIVSGAKEIVSKYNVDGIHIDDYFYQSSFGNSFDKSAFTSSGYTNLSQFRLDSVSQMVKELYSGVKSVNSSVQFGISPAGNISNLYAYQYADVKKWCSESGYCDYIVPQIYWGFSHKSAAYDKVLDEWCAIHTNPNVKLVVGLAAYRAGNSEMASEKNVLAKQVATFKNTSHYGGAAFFRYESLFNPPASEKEKINAELNALLDELF